MSFTVFEEDVSHACELARKYFGPVGNIIYPSKNALVNYKLETKEHGKIWYGDIEKSVLQTLTALEAELGTEVSALPL